MLRMKAISFFNVFNRPAKDKILATPLNPVHKYA